MRRGQKRRRTAAWGWGGHREEGSSIEYQLDPSMPAHPLRFMLRTEEEGEDESSRPPLAAEEGGGVLGEEEGGGVLGHRREEDKRGRVGRRLPECGGE